LIRNFEYSHSAKSKSRKQTYLSLCLTYQWHTWSRAAVHGCWTAELSPRLWPTTSPPNYPAN